MVNLSSNIIDNNVSNKVMDKREEREVLIANSLKRCSNCKVIKKHPEFHKNKARWDGLAGKCKSCEKDYREANKDRIKYLRKTSNKAYREANRDRLKALSKAYYYANRDKMLARDKTYYEANKDKKKAYNKAYREANKNKINAYNKSYYEENKDILKALKKAYYEANRDKLTASNKVYREANKDKIIARNVAYERKRRESDPLFRLVRNVRCLIFNSIKRGDYSKDTKTAKILGCSFEELSKWLDFEKWINEDCHIDHVVPVSFAETKEEILVLNHYSNLQVLSAEENIKKGNRFILKSNLQRVLENHPKSEVVINIINRNNILIK